MKNILWILSIRLLQRGSNNQFGGEIMLTDCKYCIRKNECGVEEWKEHSYNKRDGKKDCFSPIQTPPWDNPTSECYGCTKHSMFDCEKCTGRE